MPKRPPVFKPPGFARTKRPPDRRASATARGYDYAWQQYAQWYLEEHPLCVECLARGKSIPATEVDHIKPLSQGGDKWDPSNHQALCKSHHSRKTRREGKA
jgi:5-methylcytosine-specific restriction endonuclease McrA